MCVLFCGSWVWQAAGGGGQGPHKWQRGGEGGGGREGYRSAHLLVILWRSRIISCDQRADSRASASSCCQGTVNPGGCGVVRLQTGLLL